MSLYSFNYQPPAGVWGSAGVPGGIPTNRTTVYTTLTSTGDTTDRTSAIQAAINACPDNQVVLLGAGYFNYTNLTFGQNNYTVLRGAGMASTILRCTGSGAYTFYIGAADYPAFTIPTTGNTVTAGATTGSTVLTVADTSVFTADEILSLVYDNQQGSVAIIAGAVPTIGIVTGANVRSQTVRLVSKTSTTLTISPALFAAPDAGLALKVYHARYKNKGSGVENLTIDMSGSTGQFGIWMEECDGCWIKDVKITGTANFNLFIQNSLECEVRRYWSGPPQNYGSNNGSGCIVERSGHCLVVDSIYDRNFPAIEVNKGTTGSVFAYNYGSESTSSGAIGVTFSSNHDPHNSFNLYEGNTGPVLQADGRFGGCSEDTIFRNWFTGVSTGASGSRDPVNLKRFTRRYQVIGNLLGTTGQSQIPYTERGTPNIGNTSFSGSIQPTAGTFWANWPTTGYDPTNTAVFDAAYQERDLDVAASSTFKGNYSEYYSGIISGESLGTDTLPDSQFLSSKPAWFGTLTWPAYDPGAPNMAATAIPSGYRFVNGSEVPTGATPTAPTSPTAGTTGSSSILVGWTDASSDETGFEVERSLDGSTGWTNVASPSAGATSVSITGLSASTLYYFRIRAVNANGGSSWTSSASATTSAATLPYNAPAQFLGRRRLMLFGGF